MARHTCHAINCERAVPPKLFMCLSHWHKLPKATRDAIWDTYRRGQEIDKKPSTEYLLTAARAILWLAKLEKQPQKYLDWQEKRVAQYEEQIAAK